jgi:hypothetical protein
VSFISTMPMELGVLQIRAATDVLPPKPPGPAESLAFFWIITIGRWSHTSVEAISGLSSRSARAQRRMRRWRLGNESLRWRLSIASLAVNLRVTLWEWVEKTAAPWRSIQKQEGPVFGREPPPAIAPTDCCASFVN